MDAKICDICEKVIPLGHASNAVSTSDIGIPDIDICTGCTAEFDILTNPLPGHDVLSHVRKDIVKALQAAVGCTRPQHIAIMNP